MIGRILSQLLGGGGHDEEEEAGNAIQELEEGEWVIVKIPEKAPPPEAEPLEELLMELPSMCRGEEEVEEELRSDEDEEDTPRGVAVRRHVSWRLAAWGLLPLPGHARLLPHQQRARAQAEHRRLSRGALCRHNLARLRVLPAHQRYGHAHLAF